MKRINLKAHLDEVSYNYVLDYFREFHYHKTGLTCFGTYDSSKWIKFFDNGRASYSPGGDFTNIIEFGSYQDCVDFARIK